MKRLLWLVLLLAAAPAPAQVTALVGGTLIDGTLHAPIDDSVVLIEGQRIKAVGRMGELAVPPGATVISTEGDTFRTVRARAEKFISEIQLTGRVEAVTGDLQYIGVTDPKKHREDLLKKIAEDARGMQTIFAGASTGATAVSPFSSISSLLVAK